MYYKGQPPKSVNMHWRRFDIASIPLDSPEKFELWLRQRWEEKDDLLEYYLVHGAFPEDEDLDASVASASGVEDSSVGGGVVRRRTKMVGGRKREMKVGGGMVEGRWEGPIETEVGLKSWWEVFEIATVVVTVGMLIRLGFRWWAVLRRLN